MDGIRQSRPYGLFLSLAVLCALMISGMSDVWAQPQSKSGPRAENLPDGIYGKSRFGQARFAQQRRDPEAMQRHMSQIMADIGLSSEQIETIKSIQSKSRDEAKTVKQALNIQRKNLMDTLHKPDATKAQMETQLDAMMKLQRKVAQMRIDAIFSMRDVMTPEQWQSFQSRMKQGRQMRGHRGPGQGGPPSGDDF